MSLDLLERTANEINNYLEDATRANADLEIVEEELSTILKCFLLNMEQELNNPENVIVLIVSKLDNNGVVIDEINIPISKLSFVGNILLNIFEFQAEYQNIKIDITTLAQLEARKRRLESLEKLKIQTRNLFQKQIVRVAGTELAAQSKDKQMVYLASRIQGFLNLFINTFNSIPDITIIFLGIDENKKPRVISFDSTAKEPQAKSNTSTWRLPTTQENTTTVDDIIQFILDSKGKFQIFFKGESEPVFDNLSEPENNH